MPIVRTYGDPAGLLGLAYQSGQATGQAQRNAQQRAADQEFIRQQQASRNRIVEMETAANLSDRGGRGGRGGGGGGTAGDPVREFLTEEGEAARRRRLEREEAEFQANLETDRIRSQRAEILHALDQKYAGRNRDLTYWAARDQVMSGKQLDDRILYSLGIKSGSEEVAADRENRLRAGQADGGAPRTASERVVRRTLEQGRGGDLADLLVERGAPPKGSPYGATGSFTTEALAARAQLAEFVEQAGNRATLKSLRESLGAKADPETTRLIDSRLRQIEQEEIEVKAPVAFEQANETFQTRIRALQSKTGGPVPLRDQQIELAKILTTTAEAYGLDIPSFNEWYRANMAQQRAARLAAQNPAAVGPGQNGQQRPPAGTTTAEGVPGGGRPEWMNQTPDPSGGFVPGMGPQPGR